MNNSYLNYIDSALKEFKYYKSLADKTIGRLTPEQIHWRPNAQSNSIAIIMQHVSGNLRSRFTNFITEDGEKSWRNRDLEFEAPSVLTEQATPGQLANLKNELVNEWEEAWGILFQTINSLSPEQLDKIVYIRNEQHTVIQAINRQVAHYPYHIGQIVFIGKWLISNWASLSIPLNASNEYNQSKGMK